MQGTGGWRALEGRDNALNFLRLVLAAMVVVGHGYVLGYGVQPPIPAIHERAVDGFFAISGFLIASSRSHLGFGQFALRRAGRVYPGLWASLIVTAGVIAPVGAAVAGQPYSIIDAAAFVSSNAAAWFQQWGIAGGPGDVPYPGVWNGSLWTLTYELGCYLVFGALLGVARRRAALVAGAVLFVTTALQVLQPPAMQAFPIMQSTRLGGFFAAGALLFHLRQHVPRAAVVAAASGVLVALAWWAGSVAFTTAAPLALAYLLLWAGAVIPVRAGSRNDISYGMYVYAFPVQQLLTLLGLASLVGPALFIVASLAATAPLAWMSWRFVERPAMRLGRDAVTAPARATRRDPTTPDRLPV